MRENRPASLFRKGLIVTVAELCGLLFALFPLMAQDRHAAAAPGSNLAITVLAVDKHSGIPAPGLKPGDFEVVSDQARLGVTSVANGSQSESRPLSVWFVMQCPEEGIAFSWVSYGSGFMRGKSRAFTPILQKLTPRDTVGVAHWCDDGTLGIDLLPTTDRMAPSESIEKVLSAPMAHVSNEPGQNGLHDVFLRVREVTQRTSPGTLPVLVFLYGDHSGMYHEQVAELLNQPSGPMPIVYGINNGAVSIQSHPILDQYTQMYVIHFLSEKTGGVVLSTFSGNYAEQLDKILQELEGRYDLGIEVADLDSKPHEITVKLSDAARKNLKSVNVRFAKVFVPSAQTTASADQSLQASLLAAIRAATPSTEIAFDASCRKSQGPDQIAQCRLYIDPRNLTWNPQESGDRQTELALVSAALSPQGSVLTSELKKFRAAQSKADQGANPKAIILIVSLPIPSDAARLQFALRDTGTSRVGTFGVGVDQIRVASSAPAH